MNKNVISVIDGAAGSCGKAKVIGEIATLENINLLASVTNCMPNAGHTYVDEHGRKTVFRNIPVSAINPNTELFIGPGSAIDMNVFRNEYDTVNDILGGRKIYVHEMTPIITQRHKNYEREHIKSGSTFKGCGAALSEKIVRDEMLTFFKGYRNALVCSNDEWFDRLYEHLDSPRGYVMLEGSQGCDLSLNHSGNYPYVTSRNVSTAQLFADSGISIDRNLETIMVIRPYPIRISNITEDGAIIFTGAYGNGIELTWTQINLGAKYGISPLTDFHHITVDKDYAEFLLSVSSPSALKQVFKGKSPNNIVPLQFLELERLYYKNRNESKYISKILPTDARDPYIYDLSELTSVTKMERRVFSLDMNKLKNNVRINSPYGFYFNFLQQLDLRFASKTGSYDDANLTCFIKKYLDQIEEETKTEILALGTGSKNGEVIKKKSLIKRY